MEIFQTRHNLVFIPINIDNIHWSLIVIHVQERRIQYYDSMHTDGVVYCDIVYRFIRQMWIKRYSEASFVEQQWNIIDYTRDAPM